MNLEIQKEISKYLSGGRKTLESISKMRTSYLELVPWGVKKFSGMILCFFANFPRSSFQFQTSFG
jgi:hypothetical protein